MPLPRLAAPFSAACFAAILPLMLMTGSGEAAPLPSSIPAITPGLIAPVCHRGWHHRSGRPCGGYGYGYRYGPPAYGYRYRYGGPPYGYGRQVCRWRTDEWGRAVRVCRWR